MRGHLRTTVLFLVGLAVVSGAVLLDPFALLGSNNDTEPVAVRDQSEIRLATLSTGGEAEGVVKATEVRPILSAGQGTVTTLVQTGTAIEPGLTLFTIDEQPTVAMTGPVPAWRTMTVDDVGQDVAQLEAGLVALGYDPDGVMTVDDNYTTTTAAIVERWQTDLEIDVTGSVLFGSVAFVPDGSLISDNNLATGQAVTPGTTVMTVASTDRELSVTVDAEQQLTIDTGTAVVARLPDRSTVEATVTTVVAAGDGTWTITGALEPAGADLPEGASVPVTITWTEVTAAEVVAVEAGALVRLDTGGYAVEVVDDAGMTAFVEVAIGERSGSTVEIITDLPAGTTVIAP